MDPSIKVDSVPNLCLQSISLMKNNDSYLGHGRTIPFACLYAFEAIGATYTTKEELFLAIFSSIISAAVTELKPLTLG
jgi:hypothetical protein